LLARIAIRAFALPQSDPLLKSLRSSVPSL
jgi:hypothetical protein